MAESSTVSGRVTWFTAQPGLGGRPLVLTLHDGRTHTLDAETDVTCDGGPVGDGLLSWLGDHTCDVCLTTRDYGAATKAEFTSLGGA